MSVPLPSPSAPSFGGNPLPHNRPPPLPHSPTHSPGSFGQSPQQHHTGRSANVPLGQSPSKADVNWRERNGASGSGGVGNGKTKGPERTVGGFERKDASGSASGSASAVNAGGKKGAVDKAGLAHVPCRFFKAGACSAGDACPFSHEEGGKKEVCQWFLKGNCKFGHKCALAHIRPGESLAMDRKNKKAAQLEAREGKQHETRNEKDISKNGHPPSVPAFEERPAAPVPIRSALSSSIQAQTVPSQRMSSSPLREPYGPPSSAAPASAGFGRSPAGPISAGFAASPNRPSPLASSFSARVSTAPPGPFPLKGIPTTAVHPTHPSHSSFGSRIPATAAPGSAFPISSSFSHSPLASTHPHHAPLSASFADGSSSLRKSIWARSETPDEPLSPRRPIPRHVSNSHAAVFGDDDDDHAEDLLPSSLSDLLTPMERARRLSRRDSTESYGSPSRFPSVSAGWISSSGKNGAVPAGVGLGGAERLAQSAGAAMGQPDYLQSLWSSDGNDNRYPSPQSDLVFGQPATAAPAPAPRQSLLSQQRHPRPPAPNQPDETLIPVGNLTPPYFNRTTPDPSSPSAKALSEHAPGQSLPGGVATALSRIHLHSPTVGKSALANPPTKVGGQEQQEVLSHGDGIKKEEGEEGMFAMDG